MNDENLDPQLLFVYGTFRSDDPLSPRNLPEHRVLAPAVLPGFGLYEVSSFPGARPNHPEREIHGQIFDYRDLPYEEWESRVRRFDSIEGHPRMFERQIVEVRPEGMEKFLPLWTYVYQTEMPSNRLIESGDWIQFRQRRERRDLT